MQLGESLALFTPVEILAASGLANASRFTGTNQPSTKS
jgi:hypothetical protein